MSATRSTPKQFFELCDRSEATQAIRFLESLPVDQQHEFVSYRDQDGRTPVYVAARNDHPQVVEMLLAAGADVNAADNYGATPILLQLERDIIKLWRCYLQLVLTRILLLSMEKHPFILQLRSDIIELWRCYLQLVLTRMLLRIMVEHLFMLQLGGDIIKSCS